MQQCYKWPFKHHARSLSNFPCSPSKLIVSPVTPSKCYSQVKKQIFQSQAYRTILCKLLKKNSIQEFIQETSQFATINDQFSQPYIKNQALKYSSSDDFPQLGKAFLKDGSFLRHYCKLLILKQPQRKEELKRQFYLKYKDQIIQKKAYFQKFFKELIKLQQYQLSQSKIQASKRQIAYSLKKAALSLKKATSQKLQRSQKVQKPLQSISALDPYQLKQTNTTVQFQHAENNVKNEQLSQESTQLSGKHKKAKKPIKHQELLEQEDLYFTSRSRRKGRYKNQTEEQRQERLLGLANSKSKQYDGKQGNIIKFADQISSNQRLKKIYQSIKKEKQALNEQSLRKTDKSKKPQVSPVYRSSYHHLKAQFQQKKLMSINAQLLQKITHEQRSLINYFPNISKLAIKDKIQKDNPIVIGSHNNRLIMKAFVIDYSSCIQPTYIAVYLQPLQKNAQTFFTRFNYQVDQDVQVLLVNDFRNSPSLSQK